MRYAFETVKKKMMGLGYDYRRFSLAYAFLPAEDTVAYFL